MNPGDVKVGDLVLIPGVVTQKHGSLAMVDAGTVITVPVRDIYPHPGADQLPEEPPDGTVLVNPCDRITGFPEVAIRKDADAPVEPDRRHQRHWYLHVRVEDEDERWVDWRTLLNRGFDPSQRFNAVLDEIDARTGTDSHKPTTREEASDVGSDRI